MFPLLGSFEVHLACPVPTTCLIVSYFEFLFNFFNSQMLKSGDVK